MTSDGEKSGLGKGHPDSRSDDAKLDIEATRERVDDEIQRRLTRKLDIHILPFLFGLWFFAQLDRANIGNANIEGLPEDLKLDGDKFNIALTIFYVPYVIVAIPSNLILTNVGAGRYLPSLAIAWGIIDTCMGSVKSYGGLLACRFFLGLCEGGMIGGMVIYLAMFYRRHQFSLQVTMFFYTSPFSKTVDGLLTTGFSEIEFNGYNSKGREKLFDSHT